MDIPAMVKGDSYLEGSTAISINEGGMQSLCVTVTPTVVPASQLRQCGFGTIGSYRTRTTNYLGGPRCGSLTHSAIHLCRCLWSRVGNVAARGLFLAARLPNDALEHCFQLYVTLLHSTHSRSGNVVVVVRSSIDLVVASSASR
jgi:hypothetical protein